MLRYSLWASLLLLTLPLSGQRQNVPPRQTVEIIIKVTYENDRAVVDQVRVQLTNGIGITVAETYTRNEGEARFMGMEPGTYRIRASGIDIEDKFSETSFNVNPREPSHVEFFQVRKKPSAQQTSTQGSISAAALNVPRNAESEFDKGVNALKKQNLDEAQKRFSRATDLYPRYAAAFNNLGFIAMQRGNPEEGKNYFSQAVKADEQYAPSYLNLAKSHIGYKEYPQALALLNKATSLDPNNVEVLALLAMLEYDSNQLIAALGHARRVHALAGHEKFAFVHYIAGKALESQSQANDALIEYRLFLKENPESPTALKARESITAIENQRR